MAPSGAIVLSSHRYVTPNRLPSWCALAKRRQGLQKAGINAPALSTQRIRSPLKVGSQNTLLSVRFFPFYLITLDRGASEKAVLAGSLADHAHGALDGFGRILRLLLHDPIFSNNGASTKPGAVQTALEPIADVGTVEIPIIFALRSVFRVLVSCEPKLLSFLEFFQYCSRNSAGLFVVKNPFKVVHYNPY